MILSSLKAICLQDVNNHSSKSILNPREIGNLLFKSKKNVDYLEFLNNSINPILVERSIQEKVWYYLNDENLPLYTTTSRTSYAYNRRIDEILND